MKKDKEYNKVIGYNKNTLEVFVCDYTFEHTPDFKGATGSILMPLSERQIEDYNDVDYVIERFEDCDIFANLEETIIDELEEKFSEENDIDEWIEKGDEEGFYNLRTRYIEVNLELAMYNHKKELAETEINYCDGAFPFHDNGSAHDVTVKDTEILEIAFVMKIVDYECIGGGRCFDKALFDDKDFVSLDDDAVAEIKKYEDIN